MKKKPLKSLSNNIVLVIPLLLMVVAVVFTFWLSKLNFSVDIPVNKPLAIEIPDVLVTNLKLNSFAADGQQILAISGSSAKYNSRLEKMNLQNFSFRQMQSGKLVISGSSNKAVADIKDEKKLRIFDDVKIDYRATDNHTKLTGEEFFINLNQKQIYSKLPIQLQQENQFVSANQLKYSDYTKQLELAGRVRGNISTQ